MGLLVGKGWIAQEFYNEYLSLKMELSELTTNQEYFKRTNREKEIQEYQIAIDEKVEKLKFVLQELKTNGVKMEDLILLSIGIDLYNS